MTKPSTPHAEDDFGNTIVVLDQNNMIAQIVGPTMPTDATAGYAGGCIFQKNLSNGANTSLYVNEGSSSSCDFNAK